MYLKVTNPGLQGFYYAEFMQKKRYVSESRTVRVPKDVGEELLERYPDSFEPTDEESEPTDTESTEDNEQEN